MRFGRPRDVRGEVRLQLDRLARDEPLLADFEVSPDMMLLDPVATMTVYDCAGSDLSVRIHYVPVTYQRFKYYGDVTSANEPR